MGSGEVEVHPVTVWLGGGDDKPRMTLGRQRQTRPAVFESELRLARNQGYLLLPDGFPVARIALTADHIETRGKARQPAFVEAHAQTTLWHQSSKDRPVEQGGGAEPPSVEKSKPGKTQPPPAVDGHGPV